MTTILASILTAALTVFGGYFLYQRQQIWNEKRKHYEFILTELEYMADAGQQIIESCDQEIYRMSCSMEDDVESHMTVYDVKDLKNKMYQRLNNIKSKMPIMELYITDKTAEFVMATITKAKADLIKIDFTINQNMRIMAESGWTPSGEDYENQYKALIGEINSLRFPAHTVIKNEMKRTNTFWDKLMKRIGV